MTEYSELWTPEKQREANKKYRLNNPDRVKESQRKYRLSHRKEIGARERANNTVKRRTWNVLYRAIGSGKIVKPEECDVCHKASPIIHGHHDDYSRPLSVLWLCPKCHNDLKQEKKNAKKP